MNADQKNLIRQYCGMWPERAQSFLDASEGKHIHPATMNSLVAHGLIYKTQNGVTKDGELLLERLKAILEDRFLPDQPVLSIETLNRIEPTARFARLPGIKLLGLRSSHLKALKIAAQTPGACGELYFTAFGMNEIYYLIMMNFLRHGEKVQFHLADKYRSLYLTERGLDVLKACLQAAK